MEIKQEDQRASLFDFVSHLEVYCLKTEGLFAHSWWLSQKLKKKKS